MGHDSVDDLLRHITHLSIIEKISGHHSVHDLCLCVFVCVCVCVCVCGGGWGMRRGACVFVHVCTIYIFFLRHDPALGP